jgi:hypothetical protein
MFDSLSHRVLVFIFILPSFDILLSYNLVGHVPKNFKFGVINPEINYDLDQCNTTYTTFQKCSANLGCSYLNTLPESVIKPVRLPIYKRLLMSEILLKLTYLCKVNKNIFFVSDWNEISGGSFG